MLHLLINKTINESLVHVTSYQCMHVTSTVHIQISLDNTKVYKFAFYICKIKYKLVNNKNDFFIIKNWQIVGMHTLFLLLSSYWQ